MADEPSGLEGTAAAAAAASLTPVSAPAKTDTADAKDSKGDAKDVKIPADLSKVSDAKAQELIDAGLVEDADLPGRMYRRKVDKFVARIPNYTWNAYADVHKDQWEELKLTSDHDPQADA